MDTEKKEIVEKKVYEDGKKEYASKSMAGTALGFGIAGTALGLWVHPVEADWESVAACLKT